jgi:hypothetical protein
MLENHIHLTPEEQFMVETFGEIQDQHAPGAKLDNGKVRPALVLDGFSKALLAVSEVGTFGARKYTDNGWKTVPNGIERYKEAKYRHQLQEATGEMYDPESGILHAAHEAWNALARLEFLLKEQPCKCITLPPYVQNSSRAVHTIAR